MNDSERIAFLGGQVMALAYYVHAALTLHPRAKEAIQAAETGLEELVAGSLAQPMQEQVLEGIQHIRTELFGFQK